MPRFKSNIKSFDGELFELYGSFSNKKQALRNAKHMRQQGWIVHMAKNNKTGKYDVWELA